MIYVMYRIESHLFADVAVTFFLPHQQKSTEWGKTKFVNIAKEHFQKKNITGGKTKLAYFEGGKDTNQ
jgi:hypothetical protein